MNVGIDDPVGDVNSGGPPFARQPLRQRPQAKLADRQVYMFGATDQARA
ncbi:MAG: hypothetical protein RR784_03575 [Burkholderiaceae bacterium]